MANINKHLNWSLLRLRIVSFSENNFSMMMLIVSSRAMLVKRESISKLAMKRLGFLFKISRENSNVSLSAQSLVVSGLRMGTRNLAMLQLDVPFAESIALNGEQLLTNYLWTLAKPYKTPKL